MVVGGSSVVVVGGMISVLGLKWKERSRRECSRILLHKWAFQQQLIVVVFVECASCVLKVMITDMYTHCWWQNQGTINSL